MRCEHDTERVFDVNCGAESYPSAMRVRLGRLCTLAVVVLLAACSLAPASPVVVLPGRDGVKELPIVLEDPEGIVLSVEAGEPDLVWDSDAIRQIDLDSAALIWLGGACDARARVRVALHEGTIEGHVITEEAIGLGCTAVGIPRAVAITFREPIGDRPLSFIP